MLTRRLTLMTLMFLLPMAVTSGQAAEAVRVGVSYASAPPLARLDTAATTMVKRSHIGKYMAIGAATGVLVGIAAIAYELKACDGKSTNGIPACLGMDTVAHLTLFTSTLVGAVVGTLAGKAADTRQR